MTGCPWGQDVSGNVLESRLLRLFGLVGDRMYLATGCSFDHWREEFLRAWADLCWQYGAEEVVSWLDRVSIREDSTVQVPKAIFCETMNDAVMIAEVVGRPVYCEVAKRIYRVQPSGKHEDVTEKVVRVASLLRDDPRQEDFTKVKK